MITAIIYIYIYIIYFNIRFILGANLKRNRLQKGRVFIYDKEKKIGGRQQRRRGQGGQSLQIKVLYLDVFNIPISKI